MTYTNTEAARRYLADRRLRLGHEISVLQGRMTEIGYLLSELDTPIPPPAPRQKSPSTAKSKKAIVLEALIAAGTSGITQEEVHERTGILRGTASSNLAPIKAQGKATHVKPRYFAVLNNEGVSHH